MHLKSRWCWNSKGQPGDIKNEIDTYSEACNEKVYNLGVNED